MLLDVSLVILGDFDDLMLMWCCSCADFELLIVV